jgi:hypothetical protein
MSEGIVKKTAVKKLPKKRMVIKKKIAKPTIARARKRVAPKKTVKKVSKKINLKVRAVATPVVKKTLTKRTVKKPLILKTPSKTSEKAIIKAKTVKKTKKQSPKPVAEKKLETATPKGRIVVERSEKDKQFLMWAGVSFFMILIVIFWAYSIKESIKRSNSEWQSSEKAITWSQMADELSDKILEIKNDIKTVRSFASSSVEELGSENKSSLFRTATSSNKLIDDDVIKNLKHDLEIKTGASEPAKDEYYFVLEDDYAEILLVNLEDLTIGDSSEQVKNILGEPNSEQELKDQRGVFIAKILSYYLKIYKENEVNENYDRYISLEFEQDDTLLKINKFLD